MLKILNVTLPRRNQAGPVMERNRSSKNDPKDVFFFSSSSVEHKKTFRMMFTLHFSIQQKNTVRFGYLQINCL